MAEFSVQLPIFEGPFDLLLFFIERDELDIADVPIARLTDEFLAYIKTLERLNLEVASEFILVAATMMKIKARMLLPRPQINEAGQEVDPREELIRHLVEYRRFKQAAQSLAELEAEAMSRYARHNLAEELADMAGAIEDNAPLHNLTQTSIALTFQRLLVAQIDRERARQHVVVTVPYTVEEQKATVVAEIALRGRSTFAHLLSLCDGMLQMVYTFMAVLELLNERTLTLSAQDGINDFVLEGGEL